MSKPRSPLTRWLAFVAIVVCAATQAAAENAASVAPEGRIVLAPINLGVTASEDLAPGVRPVWKEILALASESNHKIAILQEADAAAIWREVYVETRAVDPEADLQEIYGAFARRIAEQVDFVSMVFPSLVLREAEWSNDTASWDGVEHGVSITDSDNTLVRGTDGNLAAASLHVKAFGPDGAVQVEGAGGLALLRRLDLDPAHSENPVVAVLPDEAFSDSTKLREGIVAAFAAAEAEAN